MGADEKQIGIMGTQTPGKTLPGSVNEGEQLAGTMRADVGAFRKTNVVRVIVVAVRRPVEQELNHSAHREMKRPPNPQLDRRQGKWRHFR